MKKFNQILTELRKSRNMTQDELAEKLHITKQALSHYERGTRYPKPEILEAIADEFNVDMNFLTGHSTKTTVLPSHGISITPYHSEIGTAPTAPRAIVEKALNVSDKPVEIQERKALGDMHASITQVVDTLKEKIDQEVKKYYSEETLETAQALFENEDMRLLFDAAQGCTPADLKMAADLLKRLKGTNPDG